MEPAWREEGATENSAAATLGREETQDELRQVEARPVEAPGVSPSRTEARSAEAVDTERAGDRIESVPQTPSGQRRATDDSQKSLPTKPTVVPVEEERREPSSEKRPRDRLAETPAPSPDDDEAVPEIEELPVEKTLQTSLSLRFDVSPDDTFVLLKEVTERRFISIGRSSEWSGKKDARIYDLPGPGEYYLRFRRQGRREVTYRIVADHAAGGPTPIVLRMP